MRLGHDLGPLEMTVLGLVESDGPLVVADVRARLAERGHELAYTTVMTVLVRLHEKRLVTRQRIGRRYAYSAARKAERATTGFLRGAAQRLFATDRIRPILALIDTDEPLSKSELEELRREVDARLHDPRGERK